MSQKKSTLFGYWTAVVALIGGFLEGYAVSIIAGALFFIDEEFGFNSTQDGWVASTILLGALVGSMSSGSLADRFGRRNSLQLSALLFFISGIAALFIDGFFTLLLVRFIAGIAAGMASILVPLYLGEIAPPSQRGAFVSAFTVTLSLGILTAYLVNYFLAPTANWRMMFALSTLPAAVQFIALFFFPKSPKWLFVQGCEKEGRHTLYKLYGESSRIPFLENYCLHSHWKDLFLTNIRLVLLLGIALSVFQQLSGINAVIYFSPKIFKAVGFPQSQALFSTLFIGVINILSTLIAMCLADRLGRRKLLLISQAGMIFTLSFLAFIFMASDSIYLRFLTVPALIIYVGSYALGMGPLVWVLIAEIYPLFIRAKAIALMTFLSWLTNYIVVLTFPPLLSKVGFAFPFFLFGLISIAAFFFFLFNLPETKGKTLEELEHILVRKDYHR